MLWSAYCTRCGGTGAWHKWRVRKAESLKGSRGLEQLERSYSRATAYNANSDIASCPFIEP